MSQLAGKEVTTEIHGRRAHRWLAILMLILMAVTMNEFLPDGTPVTPFSLLIFFLIPLVPLVEGFGVLLVRETALR
ncbi:MAG: hypothetical protein ACRECH_10775 [Nitrososphaerales archaeon]